MKLESLINKEITKELESIPDNEAVESLPGYLLNDPNIVGFPDLEMQSNIYAYATQGVLPLVQDEINPIAVVDIGAGRGDFRAFLQTAYPIDFEYYGYEINPILKEASLEKYELGLRDDFLEDSMNFHGWGFCIGSLNDTYGRFIDETKYEYFLNFLERCLSRISIGVVFILLSDNSDNKNLIEYPVHELLEKIQEKYPNIPFSVDYTRFNGVYKLVIYNTTMK